MKNRIVINVIDSISGKKTIIYPCIGERLMDAMIRVGLTIRNDCGGTGTCGKCMVRLVEGYLDITSQDRDIFSESDLSQGYRLACMAYPGQTCTILMNSGEHGEFKVLTETLSNPTYEESSMKETLSHNNSFTAYAIAIDLGTTTLALALVDSADGNIQKNYTAMNPQRAYGADVISRIKASNDGKQELLARIVRDELLQGIRALINNQHISLERIQRIVISGNTTMIHLLMGYSCAGLGAYPFTPVELGFINTFSDELFATVERLPVVILPGISVFVGGDITGGLLACGFDKLEKPCLLVDMGTNGEMALGNRDRIIVTGTAAGPAFEGGNISCGVGSIPGAISRVYMEEGSLGYETINNVTPVGLCGTGVIELVSELLQEGIIDNTGLLMDPYFDTGYPVADMSFTQKDIRELQLAKAAIRAGITILTKSYGISMGDLDRVYIAGGFGYYLDIQKAAGIGLLPDLVINKTQGVGNTSLSGAILAMTNPEVNDRIKHIISIAEEIHLSNDKDFNDIYIQHMSF